MYNNVFDASQALNGIRGRTEGRYNNKKRPDPVSFREGRGGATPVLHPDAGPHQRAVEEASRGHGLKIQNPSNRKREQTDYRSLLYNGANDIPYGPERLRVLRQNFLQYMNGGRNGE